VLLAVAVAPSNPLLDALWIPWQVIVDDGVAELEVQPLCPRLRGNEDSTPSFELVDQRQSCRNVRIGLSTLALRNLFEPALERLMGARRVIGPGEERDFVFRDQPAFDEAFAQIALRYPRFGKDDELLGSMGTAALFGNEAKGLEERVIFAGFVTNVASWLKRAGVAITISETEGHPNAVLEAAAAGAPLVLSDIGAHRAIVDESSAAFVPPLDVHAIAEAIDRTLEDRDAALGRASRARSAISGLTLEATVTEYERAYRRVAGNDTK